MRYLIVTYFQKPNGKYNESVNLDSKVRSRDMTTASVILDFKDRKIVKSRFQDELGVKHADFETLHKFYSSHYPDVVSKLDAKFQVLDEMLAEAKKELVDGAS